MRSYKGKLPSAFHVSSSDDGDLVLEIRGRMDVSNAAEMIRGARRLVSNGTLSSLTVDLADVDYLDDFGSLVLLELRESMEAKKGGFYLKNASEKVQKVLSVFQFDRVRSDVELAKKRRPSAIARLGEATLDHWDDLKYLISFVGSVCLALLYVVRNPKSLRKEDTLLTMQQTGFDALPIVGLISLLLGMILAFMSSVQLKQFGADIYVASLVSVAMVRELGPVMTAIIVAGRSGS
ncbi:MAG: ABC transporter permease, partial [Desulfobacteraceae bacterium]